MHLVVFIAGVMCVINNVKHFAWHCLLFTWSVLLAILDRC